METRGRYGNSISQDHIHVRLPLPLKEDLKRACERRGMSMSTFARLAIELLLYGEIRSLPRPPSGGVARWLRGAT